MPRARKGRGASANDGSEELEKKETDGHDQDQAKQTGEAGKGDADDTVLTPPKPRKSPSSKTPRTPEKSFVEKMHTETRTGTHDSSVPPVGSRPHRPEFNADTVQLQGRKAQTDQLRAFSVSMERYPRGTDGGQTESEVETVGMRLHDSRDSHAWT